ncbi:UNVERIFIED_CONTAM: hypothetical protein RMT77_008974 [Armadillidium vulgare]
MENNNKKIKNKDDLKIENKNKSDLNDLKHVTKTDFKNGSEINIVQGTNLNDLNISTNNGTKEKGDLENNDLKNWINGENDLEKGSIKGNDLEKGTVNESRKSSVLSLSDKPLIGLRWIIVLMIFLSYVNLFFLRNSIGVIVVAIVNVTSDDETDYTKDACPAAINKSEPANAEVKGPQYYWGQNEQGFILGAYFWGYVISRLFLTRLSEKFGQRETFCLSMVVAGLVALVSPWTASVSGYFFAVTRFITGVCFGPSTGVVSGLLSAWAPKSELSLMASVSFCGATVGGTLGVFLSGWLSEALGWPSLFYIGGVLNLIVAPFWMIVATNNPFDHPWLTNYERELLKDKKHIRTKKSAPWLKITTSPYVLICIYGTFARSWLDQILNNEGPSFFGYKIGLDVDTSSYIVGVSSISSVVFMLVCGKSSDYITNKKILSRLNTRKLFHIIGSGIPVIILLGLTWTGCNSTAAIIWFVALAGTTVATISSFTLSVIDIAPNHTGTVNALLAVGSLGSAIAPSIIAALLSTDNGWNKSFYLCAGINAISLIIYVLFMTDKPQPWNFDKERKGSAAGSINQEPKGSPAGTRNKEPKDSPTGSTNRRRKNSPSGSLNKETKNSPTGRNEEPKDSTTGSLNKEPKDNPIGGINREPKDSPTGTISKEPKTSPASTIKLEPKISPVDKTKL